MSAAADAATGAGDPIRYASELELHRARAETWMRMQWAMESNDTEAVSELARRLDDILQALDANSETHPSRA